MSIIVNDEMSRNMRIKQLEAEDKRRAEEEAKAKKDDDFVKDFRDSLPLKRALNKENQWALMIFEFLKTKMDHYNCIMCSSTVLEEYFEISRSTVSLAIKALIKHKFIEVKKSGSSNIYFINYNIAWASWANQKKYAEFGTKVVISESEQDRKT